MKNSREIRSNAAVLIVKTDGSNLVKSDAAWNRLRERANGRAFPNRSAAKLHSGRTSR